MVILIAFLISRQDILELFEIILSLVKIIAVISFVERYSQVPSHDGLQ